MGMFSWSTGSRPARSGTHLKQPRSNLRGWRRQIHRGEPDTVPLNDGCLVNALSCRRMQEQPFGMIRKGISATDLGSQVGIDLDR